MEIKRIYVIALTIFNVMHLQADTATVYQWRLYCETEQQNVYTWNATEPTFCPNNPAHIINTNSISIVDVLATNLVSVQDETTPTGHNFKNETRSIIPAPGPDVVTTLTFSWPYDVTIMNMYFVTTTVHQGDWFTIDLPFDYIFGTITAPVNSGDTSFYVAQTVIDNLYLGYMLFLDDGTNLDALGRVIAIDEINNIVTTENAAVHAFSPDTPTYVKVTRRNVDFEIGYPALYSVGIKTLEGSHVPANVQARLEYTNSSANEKIFILIYEYLY